MDYEIFTRLLNVKGIGAKTALAMLTKCPGADMARAIEEGDVKLLKSLPGIGVKSASQIVLDLQGKLVSIQREEIEIGDPVWMQTQERSRRLDTKRTRCSPSRRNCRTPAMRAWTKCFATR